MNFRKLSICILAIATLQGCTKIIEQDPTHQLDGDDLFRSVEDYEFALVGAYRLLQQANYYGAGSNAFVALPDMLSDNLNETSESLGNQNTLTTWRFAEDETNIGATWIAAYQVISQANVVNRGIDTFASEDPYAVNRVKGQAMALRAMVHFDIMRYWVEEFDRNSTKPGIPYVRTINYESKPSRGTIKETWDNIFSDLHQARAMLLDTDQQVNGAARAYIDADVVDAILARAYLYANVLDSAAHYAGLLISNYPLASATEFGDIWEDASNAEVIWSVIFNAGEGRIGDNVYFVPNNRSSYRPNADLINTYDAANDLRYPAYFRMRSNRLVLSKYLSKAAQATRPDGVVNFKAFRVAEMYLIRAEALARLGMEGEALDDLNDLRQARITGFTAGTESGAALINAIALERRKELVGEGHRFFDLKRTTRTITRSNCTVFCTLQPNDRAWAWPIPIGEMNANPSIAPQNPGY